MTLAKQWRVLVEVHGPSGLEIIARDVTNYDDGSAIDLALSTLFLTDHHIARSAYAIDRVNIHPYELERVRFPEYKRII